MIDRKKIIEQVVRIMYGSIFYNKLCLLEKKLCDDNVENFLINIGFFELLEAADKVICAQPCTEGGHCCRDSVICPMLQLHRMVIKAKGE